MLAIKLARRGKKNQPFFRIVILEKTKNPKGNFLEDLGFYNPKSKEVSFKGERIKYWISQGAQPTGSVNNLLVAKGIIKGKKVKVTKIHKKKIAEAEKKKNAEKKEKKEEKDNDKK